MLVLGNKARYYMCCTPVDIRKGFDGLAGLVRNHLGKDPLEGDIFVFLNKNKTHLKMLLWNGDGFVIYYKRLEEGTFDLLKNEAPSRELKREELLLILEGIRLENCKKKRRFLLTK
jgi:transposase